MSLFFNSRYDLRSGWKFALFLAVLIPILIGVGLGLRILSHSFVDPNDFLHEVALTESINVVSVALATLFMARVVENFSLRAVGVGFFRGWAGNLLAGF